MYVSDIIGLTAENATYLIKQALLTGPFDPSLPRTIGQFQVVRLRFLRMVPSPSRRIEALSSAFPSGLGLNDVIKTIKTVSEECQTHGSACTDGV